VGRKVAMVVWGGKGVILVTFLLRQTRIKSGCFIEILRTLNALFFFKLYNKQNVRSTALP
jgi:hypothetical protein